MKKSQNYKKADLRFESMVFENDNFNKKLQNSTALTIVSKKEFKNNNILSPAKPNNFPPDEEYYRKKIPLLDGKKIKNCKIGEHLEAVYTTDKGLIFKKKKTRVKKLALEKSPIISEVINSPSAIIPKNYNLVSPLKRRTSYNPELVEIYRDSEVEKDRLRAKALQDYYNYSKT